MSVQGQPDMIVASYIFVLAVIWFCIGTVRTAEFTNNKQNFHSSPRRKSDRIRDQTSTDNKNK